MNEAIDIIGDVHGQYEKLTSLLMRMGYRESKGAWRHPERTALFVGDLIDRGPQQIATVALVRSMVDAGTARCILGNHEFNAVSWVTQDESAPGKYLRPHTPGNRHQHKAFLEEVEGKPAHAEIVAWFKTLPLWLDLASLRVIHACWHAPSLAVLSPWLGAGNTLSEELVRLANRRGHPAFEAVEVLLKGPEVRLPDGAAFADKEGKLRHEVRLRWWVSNPQSYEDAVIVVPGDLARLPDAPLPAEALEYTYDGPPVVFGHYWFKAPPGVISPNFACVDFSAAKQGPLVAYRWNGETQLRDDKLVW